MSRREFNLLSLVGCVFFTTLRPLRAQLSVGGVFLELGVIALDAQWPATACGVFLWKKSREIGTMGDREHKLVPTVKVPGLSTSYVIGRERLPWPIFVSFCGPNTEKVMLAAREATRAETSLS